MAPKVNRNITDFFKPFAQPKIKRISATDERSVSGPHAPAPALTTKVHDKSSRASMPLATSVSSTARDTRVAHSHESTKDLSALTPIPSSPPALPANLHEAGARYPRELSPLSSLASSPSPPPSPPPTVPKKQDTLVAPAMDPSVSSSSLSSVPVSSQTSSKRIIRDGMLAVTNSDSDSLDSSSDPLDDIDELIRRKRLKMTPPAPSTETPRRPSTSARELRSSTRRDRPSIAKSKFMPPPRKTYKFSLASLVASKAKDDASKQRIHRYEEEHEQEINETARLERELKDACDLNPEEFANRLQPDEADPEKKERFVMAIKRNDVLEKDVKYHFFRHADPRTHSPKPFLNAHTSEDDWTSLLQDTDAREESFRSGFAADMARVSALPDEIVQWTLCELLQDHEANLACGYIEALDSSFRNRPFTTEHMHKHFLLRSGREDLEPDLFASQKATPPPVHQRPCVDEMPLNIRWACMLLTRVADGLRVAERRSWITTLMLLLVDPQLEQNLDTQAALQDCIASLFEADTTPSVLTASIEDVGQRIRAQISNPILVHRLVCLLPSSTATSHTFKRRMAMATFMKSNSYLSNALEDTSTMALVALYLRENQSFKITRETDFHKLGARFGILDVALGAGASKFEFRTSEATAKADSPVSAEVTTSRLPPSDEEGEFNAAIDEVMAELRSIAFNIRDPGATHMRRTECKTAIEKLSYRLEFAARTRPKPKKGIFGAAEGASEVIRNFVGIRE